MFAEDSHNRAHGAVAGRALVLAALAVLAWAAGQPLAGLESWYYDFLQRLTAGKPTAQVTIVTVPASESGSLWTVPSFPVIVQAAARSGALALIPASPPPTAVRPGELQRLSALLAGEERANAGETQRLDRLRTQLTEIRSRIAQQDRNIEAVAAAGNVVVIPHVGPKSREGHGLDSACQMRLEPLDEQSPPNARLLQATPFNSLLCESAAALAHLQFAADGDGIVRRQPDAIVLPEGILPPVSAVVADRLAAQQDSQAAAPLGRPLLRYYAGSALAATFPTVDGAELAAGRPSSALAGRVAILTTADTKDGLRTSLGDGESAAIVAATSIANRLSGDGLRRPYWAPALELVGAILLGLGLGVAAAWLPLQRAAAIAFGIGLGLLATEAAAFVAGTWLHLTSLAAFSFGGFFIAAGLTRWAQGSRQRKPAAGPVRDPGLGTPVGELDLAFSVMRQQPTTDDTKTRLYDLAMEHGRRRDYARAERVFRHLASRDPNYRDVNAKLERLSGARLAAQPAEQRASSGTPAQPMAARSLGRYELERVLGRGAMATVYLGRDPTINRRVAIKTVPLAEEFEESDLSNAKVSFRREAESAGRLNHPNIISIYDAGEDGNVAYLAMEYFEGQPLNYYTQMDQLLPPRIVFELIARAAEALHYAHSQNVVHRDVKPANMLFDRASDTLKLTDFGIARLTDANRTRTGIILGTPSYMSPEQLNASKVSGQSDLYSLGVTMYHLLTGSPPFQADSIPKLMEKIANEQHRAVREFRDDIPPCTDAILSRAMAKDPAQRFPDGRSMALALRECSDSVPAEFA